MPVRLTETERKVAELHARGLKPREIAERLGISINTVYKALSKARKYMETVNAPNAELPLYYVFSASVYTYPTGLVTPSVTVVANKAVIVQDLYGIVLKKLDEILALLKERELNRGAGGGALMVVRQNGVHSSPEENHNGHMPEALKRNVWISLLRSKVT